MKNKGLCWHVHHNILAEHCYSYKERVRQIKGGKPQIELEPRLSLLQPVKGKVPAKVEASAKECSKAWKALDESKYGSVQHDAAVRAVRRAIGEHKGALAACKREMILLHKKECPDCIWDGFELDFSQWDKKKK